MNLNFKCVLLAFLVAFSATAFGRVSSLNTFAVNKVYTAASNTIVCVPWSGYSTNAVSPELKINKLVNSMNLHENDQLWACHHDRANNDLLYDVWELQADHSWKQLHVVKRYDVHHEEPYGSTNNVTRGTGLWVVRNSHGEEEIPVYLHGQYATNEAPVSIASGSTNEPFDVMLANPDYTQAMNVNDMVDWENVGVSSADKLSIPGTKGTMYPTRNLKWDANAKKWTYPTSSGPGTKVGGFVVDDLPVYSSTCQEVCVPAGRGFWYVRKSASPDEITVTFKKPSFAK